MLLSETMIGSRRVPLRPNRIQTEAADVPPTFSSWSRREESVQGKQGDEKPLKFVHRLISKPITQSNHRPPLLGGSKKDDLG